MPEEPAVINKTEALTEAKLDVLRRLAKVGLAEKASSVGARPTHVSVPLSMEQEHIWVHAGAASGVLLYNEAITVHRRGPCNVALLRDSLNEVVRRHEIWRTDFRLENGVVVQHVHASLVLNVPLVDLTTLQEADREGAALHIATEDVARAFDLGCAPLLRGQIVKLGEDNHRLYLTLHHIIFDGVSLYRVFLPTLTSIYKDLECGCPVSAAGMPPPTVQYGDYVIWRAHWLKSRSAAQKMAYWAETLAGDLLALRLPTDRLPPALPSYRGGVEAFGLSAAMSSRIKSTSRDFGLTPYAWLLTAFKTLLFRLTQQTDLVVGGVTDTRTHSDVELMMGYCLNSLPIRTRPSGTMSFLAYARQTSEAVLGMIDAREVPLSQLVRALEKGRDPAKHPLFQVLFSIQPPTQQVAPGWDLTQMDVNVTVAKFDIYFELEDRPGGFIGRVIYSSDLYDATTIGRTIEHWQNLLQSSLEMPYRTLAQLPFLTAHEITCFTQCNATATPIPLSTLHDLFEVQALSTPDACAVMSSHDSCSYAELDRRANMVASGLIGAGVAPGDLVAICLDRSANLIAAMLGILKAGAAYLPLDPTQPKTRLAECISQAAATAVLTDETILPTLARTDATPILLEHLMASPACRQWPKAHPGPETLAYVLCTSGTTGKPKAVEITHGALVNVLLSIGTAIECKSNDVMLATTTIAFDIAALELFLPLLCGGKVSLASREITSDPFLLADHIAKLRPTIMQGTPSTFRALIDAGWQGAPTLRLLAGGEALMRPLAEDLLHRAGKLWNVYGPTETTIWSTLHQVQSEIGPVPIGQPLANTSVFVVDQHGHTLPIGAHGELCIGGIGVARGYRGDPAMTNRCFTQIPAAPGQRVYRTGDIVRRRADGALEWLGRNDDQAKIRGYRIEPGEVEAALAQLPGVHSAAVVAVPDTSGAMQLIAHVVADGTDETTLRCEAAACLPGYMLPSRFHFHDSLPLTANGKIDRKSLGSDDRDTAKRATAHPMSPTEASIADIWRTLLACPHIETADDFFAVGGHSLLSVRLLAAIEATFGCRIGLAQFLQSPTIESLAGQVERALANAKAPGAANQTHFIASAPAVQFRLVRPARGGSRGVVIGIQGTPGHAVIMGQIAANALHAYDIWTFALGAGSPKLFETGQALVCAQSIAEHLREKGLSPLALFGFSLGGFVSWLVDRLLVAQGRSPTPLINFDGGVPAEFTDGAQQGVAHLFPKAKLLSPTHMLLLNRAAPERFTLPLRSETQWQKIGLQPRQIGFRTLEHLDVVLPHAIKASAEAIDVFLGESGINPSARIVDIDFATDGGTLFRLVARGEPADPATIRSFLKAERLSADGNTLAALLYLSVASGDRSLALDHVRRIIAQGSRSRAITYAQVALLAELGLTTESAKIADAWCVDQPEDHEMKARAQGRQGVPQPSGRVRLGSPASIELALGKEGLLF